MKQAAGPLPWHDVSICNLCGGTEHRLYAEIPNRHPTTGAARWYAGKPIRLVECESCGLVFASPRPDLHRLYAGYINASDSARDAIARKRARNRVNETHHAYIKQAMGLVAGKPAQRLFDMGCGAGTTLIEARKLGLDAEGNEINRASVDLLVSEGFKVYHGFTQELDLPKGAYDIVLNLDYLEHTYTPLEDLRTCFDILRPGGALFLKTLYLGCPAHREKGNDWQLFGPGHFHFFTPAVLRRLVEKAGFNVLEASPRQPVSAVRSLGRSIAGRLGLRQCDLSDSDLIYVAAVKPS